MSVIISLRKKIIVPKEDKEEAVSLIENWFKNNPERNSCTVSVFGHELTQFTRGNVEWEVEVLAAVAKPYQKV